MRPAHWACEPPLSLRQLFERLQTRVVEDVRTRQERLLSPKLLAWSLATTACCFSRILRRYHIIATVRHVVGGRLLGSF